MIEPSSISERLLFTTARIETDKGSGTGFFFNFKIDDQTVVPILVTNKHVIENDKNKEVRFFLHLKEGELPVDKTAVNLKTEWFFHDHQDLAFCFVAPLLFELKKQNKEVFFAGLGEDIIWSNEKLNELTAVEDVFMVGYPNGLWDEKNNLPLIRKGITASHPAIDFNRLGIGVVDMACFPGSSGSPIFILMDFAIKKVLLSWVQRD